MRRKLLNSVAEKGGLNLHLEDAPRLRAPHLSEMKLSMTEFWHLIIRTAMAHIHSHDREGRYHKRVKPCSLATETSCWWGRAQLPREWWCLVVLMEEGGTSSQLHPLHESTGTLKSQTSEDFNKSMINS